MDTRTVTTLRRVPEEIVRSYADALAGADTDQADEIRGEARYVTLLYTHDWGYEFSDDRQRWLNGMKTHQELLALQKAFDPDHTLMVAHGVHRKEALSHG